MEMILVQGGTFMMGAHDEFSGNEVTLSDFYIGKYLVTQKEWIDVMDSNPSHFKGGDLPVESVSCNDVQEYISKLNKVTGKTYRLPTEAEWEYAARGGIKSQGFKYAGSDNLDEVAWCKNNSGAKTHPVGKKKPNELGLYDMSGNVWTWCEDWDREYEGSTQGTYRSIRGGSWYGIPYGHQVAVHYYAFAPDGCYDDVGVRLAMSVS